MKRYVRFNRNLKLIYSSKRILAADGGRPSEGQAKQLESELFNLFKNHISKISNEITLDPSYHYTTDRDWRIELDILYPGVESWDKSRQASDSIWVYYDPNTDLIYMYHTKIDDVNFDKAIANFKHVQDCTSIGDLPLNWDIIERNIRTRFEKVKANETKKQAFSAVNPSKELKRILDKYGILTTPRSKYELVWHDSGSRGGYGTPHTTTYVANGDWLACFGMKYRGSPTVRKLLDDYGYDLIETIEEYASNYPTVDELLEGVGWEWASPDEYRWVESLTNLTTGEVLYEADVDPEEVQEFDEDDPWFAN